MLEALGVEIPFRPTLLERVDVTARVRELWAHAEGSACLQAEPRQRSAPRHVAALSQRVVAVALRVEADSS